MKGTKDALSWREENIMNILRRQPTMITTRAIYQLADMAKATALKHLAVLEAKNLVGCVHIGPTKLWWVIECCLNCGDIMQKVFMLQCPNCKYIKGEDKNEKNEPQG